MTQALTSSRRRGFVTTSVAVGVAGAGIVAAFAVWVMAAGFGLAGHGADAGADENPVSVPVAPFAKVITPVEVPQAESSFAMPASVPLRVVIPSIGVDAALMDLGLMPDGSLQVPPDGTLAGWYTGAPTPGERGPAIIAGHVDWYGPAVFHDLGSVVPGDTVEVTRADGTIAVFDVTKVGQYSKAEFPTDEVYGAADFAALRLITCGGVFDHATGHYDDNVVVYARLVT